MKKIPSPLAKISTLLVDRNILYSAPALKAMTVLSSFITLAIIGRNSNQFLINMLALTAAVSILIAINDKGATIANSNPSLEDDIFYGARSKPLLIFSVNGVWIIAALILSFLIFFSKDGYLLTLVMWVAIVVQVISGTTLTRWMHVKKRSDKVFLGLLMAELFPSLIKLGATSVFLYTKSFIFYFLLLSIFLLGFSNFVINKFKVYELNSIFSGKNQTFATKNSIKVPFSSFYYSVFSSSRDQILFLVLPLLGLSAGTMLSLQAKMVQSANLILAGIYPYFVRHKKNGDDEKIKKILIVMVFGVFFLSIVNNYFFEFFEFALLGSRLSPPPPYIFALLSWFQPLIASLTYIFLISSKSGYAIVLEKLQMILAFTLVYMSFKIEF